MTSFAALLSYAPLLVALKSGWELSRMIRDKRREHHFNRERDYVWRLLRLAYSDGIIESHEYHKLREFLRVKDRKF